MFERLIGLIGIFVLLATAFLLSNNRSKINYRTVGWGFGLQFIFAFLILKTPIGKPFFGFFDKAITKLISFSNDGANFLFGDNPIFESFAFRVLPSIIFFFCLNVCFISFWNYTKSSIIHCKNYATKHGY